MQLEIDNSSRASDTGGRSAKTELAPSRPLVAPGTLLSLADQQALTSPVNDTPAAQVSMAAPDVTFSDENNQFRAAQLGASQGKADAQFALGVAHLTGRGVRKDQQEAINWFKQAATKGHDGALTYMQLWDDQLEAAAAGGTVAVAWLKEGARRWDLDSLFRMGYLFETGSGVTPSVIEATKWYRLAAGEGHSEARRRLSAIERGGRAALEPPVQSATALPGKTGLDGRIIAGIVVLLLVGCGVYVRRKGLPRMAALARVSVPGVGAPGAAKATGPASEDLAFLKDLWSDGAAAHAKTASPAPKPAPAADAGRRPSEEERPAREAKPERPRVAEAPEAVAAPAAAVAARPAETPVVAPAPAMAQAATAAPREASGKVTAAELKSATDQSRKGDSVGVPMTADLEPGSRFDNVRHILAEDFVRVGISRDELAAGRISADSLFGGAVPLDRAGKVLRRVSGDPQRLSADSLMSEFGSNFAAEGMPAPRKPVPTATGAAIAPQAPQTKPAPAAAAPAKAAPVRPAAVKPVAAEIVTPPLDMHAPLTQDEERSLAEVHFNIGLMFARGEGVPKNDQLAAKWYLKAAEEGLAEAQFNLSEFYAAGIGVKADPSKAAYWLEKATQGGFIPAREQARQRNQAG